MNTLSQILEQLTAANPSASAPHEPEGIFDSLHLQQQYAREIASHASADDSFLKGANALVAVGMFAVLHRFHSRALTKRLNQKPELFFQLIAAQCDLARSNLEQEKFVWKKEQAEHHRLKREQTLRARKPLFIAAQTIAAASAAFTSLPHHSEPAHEELRLAAG